METSSAAASFLAYCAFKSLRPKTIDFYRWGLRHLESECQDLPTDHRPLMSILANRKLAPASRRGLERALRRFFRWLETEYGWANPMGKLERLPKRRALPRTLSPCEIDRVWAACADHRDRAMVAAVLDTGIRLGELAGLRRWDVGPDSLRVDGKTGQRRVPMTPIVGEMLRDLGDANHVWTGKRGPMSRVGVGKAIRRVLERAGLTGPKRGPHVLRHTFATEYCASGGNLRVLQEIMGHQYIETTMVYVHLAGRSVADDHARHSPAKALPLGEERPPTSEKTSEEV